MIILRITALVFGILLVAMTFFSAVRTFVVPRSASERITGLVFLTIRKIFDTIAKALPTYEQRDSLMALYAPLSLIFLVPTWLFFTTVGYTLIYWGLGITPLSEAFVFSGSSILTLGFATADTLFQTFVAFTEATIGLILVAMLISYLPTMYSAFSKREAAVSLLEVRAGQPPTAPELVWRLQGITPEPANQQQFWESWEQWFTEIDENHTSLAALVFFRSPQAGQSWINAAGAVMDGAALTQSTVDLPFTPYPALVLRSGMLALRHIADFFKVDYNPDPHFPQDAITVTRAEFEAAYDRLTSQGVPLKANRDLAWQNFAGWRVNYDSILVALSKLTMAPEFTWLSDRTFVQADPTTGETGGSLKKVE